MSNKNPVDFIVVGAQKSATTSLFKYLSEHPNIYMPPEKEINFFSDNAKFSQGVKWYFREYFNSADLSLICGEASPNYMCYDYVPKRIHRIFPEIKLIAILRNPIERAYSHYRMAVRKKIEDRPFDVCIRHLIERGNVSDDFRNEEIEFITFGEYGRILSKYLEFFPKNKLFLIFMENLVNEPVKYMRDIFNFLGVSTEFYSNIFGKKFHPGGEKRFSFLEKLLNLKWVKQPLRILLPPQLRRNLGYRLITQYTVRPTEDLGLSHQSQRILLEYYRDDVYLLENLYEIQVPWKEFKNYGK